MLLKRELESISSQTQGTSIKGVTKEDVVSLNIHVPSLEEQQAIGGLFTDLDALIEQHRAKRANLQQTKTALLQRMFPQDGANEPELRLGGFSGAWETTEVKHIATRAIGGGTPSRTVDEHWNGSIPWIQSSDVKEHTVFGCTPKHFISSRGLASSATSLVKGGSIAIVTRVGVGKVAIMNEDYCASQDFLNLSGLQGDLTFLGVLLQSELEEMSSQTQGTSIKGLTKENVLSLSIQVPTLEEQRAIGEVFTNLDALIAAEHRYITQLTQAKTALLQRMFV
ncbi:MULTISPECIES: restriction endonuclease subunit S [Corynebacterium]|uniref:restriction endonuclease subunit S n=1 Tax=Corynebacterium TaxID=1716 RepID=UPI0020B155A4|nr:MULTISPECIES: restriction endonuclease subunit S [Corynebacterium]